MSTANSKQFSLQQIRPSSISLVLGADGPCKDRLIADLIKLNTREIGRWEGAPSVVICPSQARVAMYRQADLRLVDQNAESALKDMMNWNLRIMRGSEVEQRSQIRVLSTLVIDEHCPESLLKSKTFLNLFYNGAFKRLSVIIVSPKAERAEAFPVVIRCNITYIFAFHGNVAEKRSMYHFCRSELSFGRFCNLIDSTTKYGACLVINKARSFTMLRCYQPFGNTIPHLLPRLRLFK